MPYTHLDSSWMGLVDEQSRLIICHTPRAASTLVVSLFLQLIDHLDICLNAEETTVHHRKIHKFIQTHWKVYCISYGDVDTTKYHIIKFVRNPYYRAVSSYRIYLTDISIGKEQATMSFEDFLNEVKKNHVNKNLLYHSTKQVYSPEMEAKISQIIRVEEMEEALKNSPIESVHRNLYDAYLQLKMRLDELGGSDKAALDHITNYSTKAAESVNYCVAQMPGYMFRQYGHPDYRWFYNQQTRALVEDIYADDIATYGYSFPWDDQ